MEGFYRFALMADTAGPAPQEPNHASGWESKLWLANPQKTSHRIVQLPILVCLQQDSVGLLSRAWNHGDTAAQ